MLQKKHLGLQRLFMLAQTKVHASSVNRLACCENVVTHNEIAVTAHNSSSVEAESLHT